MMFNDFLVRPVTEAEVFSFSESWKSPAVIMLERVDRDSLLDLSMLPTFLDPRGLFQDVSLALCV